MSLPIWMEYMQAAFPRERDRPFPSIPDVTWVPIEESTGRVAAGGRSMPYLVETVPQGRAIEIGQVGAEDFFNQGL